MCWNRISQTRLDIETRFQWSTYKKWHMKNRMVTWSMTSRDPLRAGGIARLAEVSVSDCFSSSYVDWIVICLVETVCCSSKKLHIITTFISYCWRFGNGCCLLPNGLDNFRLPPNVAANSLSTEKVIEWIGGSKKRYTSERNKTVRWTKTRGPINFLTLGVVGVVGVLVADATNFEGPKVPNFIEKPPFLFASEQSRMSTLSVQKFWAKKQLIILRNSAKHIWPNWPSSEVTEKQKPGKRSCVIVLDTPSQLMTSKIRQTSQSILWRHT